MNPTRAIGIVGSRHAVSEEQVCEFIDAMLELSWSANDERLVEIVSGGASGVDTIAATYARRHGYLLREFRPSDENGTFSQRCYKRNAKIADYVEYLGALPCEHSTGTLITVRLFNAKKPEHPCVPHLIACGLGVKYLRQLPLPADR